MRFHDPVHPLRKTGQLHRGRISSPGGRYFITFVTAGRKRWLAPNHFGQQLVDVLSHSHNLSQCHCLAATVMPDHAHVLFELGAALSVGQTVAMWKADVRRRIGHSEAFQRDFWEHRLGPDEEAEQYALYMFLNPYRAGLIGGTESWPGWWLPDPRVFRFSQSLDAKNLPPKEWLVWPEAKFDRLAVGE
ncbi:MAG: transposase [Opitutus sp.]